MLDRFARLKTCVCCSSLRRTRVADESSCGMYVCQVAWHVKPKPKPKPAKNPIPTQKAPFLDFRYFFGVLIPVVVVEIVVVVDDEYDDDRRSF
jgi:hypothetical protein